MLFLAVCYLAALVWLLYVARKDKSRYAMAKGLCSSLFVICGIASSWGRLAHPAVWLFLGALVLCAFGDVFLGVANRKAHRPSKRPFLAGAVSFTLAHLVFCVLFYGVLPLRWQDLLFPAGVWLMMWLLEKTEKIRLKKMRPLAYLYALLVALMAGKAVHLFVIRPDMALMAVGSVLFFASDIILLFLYFGVKRAKWMRPANLLAYYGGIYLMAMGSGMM